MKNVSTYVNPTLKLVTLPLLPPSLSLSFFLSLLDRRISLGLRCCTLDGVFMPELGSTLLLPKIYFLLLYGASHSYGAYAARKRQRGEAGDA